MFVLEREEQFHELLQDWAWRYKHRRLIKAPLPDTPELLELMHRLCRCSGPSIQEAWAVTRQREGSFLWVEEPEPAPGHPILLVEGKSCGEKDITSCWDWEKPCQTENAGWFYPLACCAPPAAAAPGPSQRPPQQIAYHSDPSAVWKLGQPLFTRFETPLSLLVKSGHPAHRILVRKQLARLFDWKRTQLIDLGESPLSLIDSPMVKEPEEYLHRFCRKIRDSSGNQPVIILCDTISSGRESAVVLQLMHQLSEKSPLLICLEPSEEISFCWTLTDEVRELPAPAKAGARAKRTDPTLLPRIARLLEIIPDRLSLNQLKKWFGPRESLQLDRCLEQGILMERSGAILIPDSLCPIRTDRSSPDWSVEEEPTLRRALSLLASPLTELKLLLLKRDHLSLQPLLRSPSFLRQMHLQSRLLQRLLEQTEERWISEPELLRLVCELALSLFLLPQAEGWLERIPPGSATDRKAAELRDALAKAREFSLDGLLDRFAGFTGKRGPRPAELEEAGYLSLAILLEIEDSVSGQHEPMETSERKMNELLFRCRCLDNPDLSVWSNTAWAHWQMKNGSPVVAHRLLLECRQIRLPRLLSSPASLSVCEALLGHWNWPEQNWPRRLPGGDLPPDRRCWDCLHLLLQHRFTEAEQRFNTLRLPPEAVQAPRSACLAGLGPESLHTLNRGGAGPLPPWLEFVRQALLPFRPDSSGDFPVPPPQSLSLVTRERNYFFFEAHYLRFHDPQAPLPAQGEEKDIFLDTCAYFIRRGRRLSRQLEAMASRLAGIALAEHRSRSPVPRLPEPSPSLPSDAAPSPLDTIIGTSPAVVELKKQIQKISRVDFTVTVLGESGTGKEMIARAIHQLGGRREAPFITFNCAALPEALLEAELFGYQKGAFTDARETRIGLIEAAEGGSLFLDEIGEMPLLLQAKLLRFLQDRNLRRLGENRLRPVNCRIICATHRDLQNMVREKSFREDLYYRIKELTVLSPPLRERKEDLPLLLDHFIEKYRFKELSLTERHWLALKWMERDWPGNVRELESRVKELITYYPHHPDLENSSLSGHAPSRSLHDSRKQFERACILGALERNDWNRSRSAEELGVSRIALFKLMRKHGLPQTR